MVIKNQGRKHARGAARPAARRPEWQRARSPENKDQRRRDLLGAALSLWMRKGWADLTMSAVAENAGVAKGTVYLYFPTKEELLLALVEEQLAEWFASLAGELERRAAATPAADSATAGLRGEAIASLIAHSLADRRALAGLLAILSSVLEHNVSVARARAFKRGMKDLLVPAGALLERALGLPSGTGPRLLLHMNALLVGIWHLATPAPPVAEALASDPDLGLFRVDFATELEHALAAMFRGLPRSA